MDEMTNKFTVIAPQNFQEFSQIFQGDTSADLYQGCDGLCENSRGFSTTVFLLPGELEFLHEVGVHPEHLLDPISTAHGLMYCWSPAATCTYLQNDRCLLGKEPYIKPVECAIYPLIFKRNGSGEFSLCPICRHRQAFLDSGFIDKAKVMMTVYLLPYLDKNWLRYRNELNFTINEDYYHRLKKEKAGQPMTIKEFKQCAVDNFN
jgi:Zn-finger nucleic acid-binding protein